jgi:Flp pilus assembly secretin CpaC
MKVPIAAIHNCSKGLLWGLVLVLLAGLAFSVPARAESTPVVLMIGASQALDFNHMRQVAVTDPTVADVIVSTWNELIIVPKNPGRCMIYVYDRCGRHDYAVVIKPGLTPAELQRHLQEIALPQWNLQYKILDYKTLYVHSTVMTDEDKDTVDKLLQDLPAKEQVNLVYLIEYATPAARQAVVLRGLVPMQYGLVVWDRGTIMITGQATNQADIDKLSDLAKAASTGGVSVINLVALGGSSTEAPVADIATALGRPYNVWLLHGRTVVVEGIAQDQAAKDRVDKLLAAFASQADIINLVHVAEKPGIPLDQQRDLLQKALAAYPVQVQVIDEKALMVQGNVPDDDTLKKVDQIVSVFAADAQVMNLVAVVAPGKKQVLVHVKVLDVRKTAENRLGIDWAELNPNNGAFRTPDPNSDLSSNANSFLFGLINGKVQTVYSIGARIQALLEANDAKELASPNLLVNDGEDANMLVGGQIPIPVPQVGGTGGGGVTITIEYKDYGVKLDFKPVVLDDKRLRLTLSPEVSDIDPAHSVLISGFDIPGFITRSETTTTDMLSGDTLSIGGLLQTTNTKVINRLPILGDLPILGPLFRSSDYQTGQTELVILVTPEIMDTTARMHTTAEGGTAAATGTEAH